MAFKGIQILSFSEYVCTIPQMMSLLPCVRNLKVKIWKILFPVKSLHNFGNLHVLIDEYSTHHWSFSIIIRFMNKILLAGTMILNGLLLITCWLHSRSRLRFCLCIFWSTWFSVCCNFRLFSKLEHRYLYHYCETWNLTSLMDFLLPCEHFDQSMSCHIYSLMASKTYPFYLLCLWWKGI